MERKHTGLGSMTMEEITDLINTEQNEFSLFIRFSDESNDIEAETDTATERRGNSHAEDI